MKPGSLTAGHLINQQNMLREMIIIDITGIIRKKIPDILAIYKVSLKCFVMQF